MPLPIYVLSLPQASRRRFSSNMQLSGSGLSFAFFDAEYGPNMSSGKIGQLYNPQDNARAFKRPLSLQEIACAYGHMEIWDDIKQSGVRAAVVLEDDFQMDPQLPEFLHEIVNISGIENCLIKLDGVIRRGIPVAKTGRFNLLAGPRLPPLTTGYIVGQRAAHILSRRLDNIVMPIDMAIKSYWRHGVPILSVDRCLIHEMPSGASQIELSRNARKSQSQFARFFANMRYQMNYKFGLMSNPLDYNAIKNMFKAG